jgi:rhomboid protease GluP
MLGGAMPTRTTFGTRQAFNRPVAEIAKPRTVAPPSTPAEPAKEEAFAAWPFLTIGLCIVLIAIFILELRHRVDPLPHAFLSVRDFVALGGVGRYFVFHEREWWRIFTAPFLHGSAEHLLGNTISLLLAGFGLERVVGRAWLAAIFLIGGVAGSLFSLAYGAALVGLGASGAIVCLLTVLFALSYHYKAGKMANWMRIRGILGVVSALLPAATHSPVQIDYGAHFGGFAAGLVLSFVLLIFWPDEEMPTPPLRTLAVAIAALGIAITLYGGTMVAGTYDVYAARSALLVPSVDAQGDMKELVKQSADFVARYPHDPQARLWRGYDLLSQRDFGDAENEVMAGLAEHEILSTEFAPTMVLQLDTVLATSLWVEGRKDEARRAAAPLCASTPDDDELARLRRDFEGVGICDAAATQ